MMEERYLYQVMPKRPITGLSGVNCLRTPKSLSLTKDEVKLCLEKGSVYRRFANESKLVKVVPSTLDRLHNSKFMTEDEYKEFKSSEVGTTGIAETAPAVHEETIAPESTENVEDVAEIVDEQAENDPVVEEASEEINEDKSEEAEEVVDTEEKVESESDQVSESNSNKQQYNNYQNNKGKNKRR